MQPSWSKNNTWWFSPFNLRRHFSVQKSKDHKQKEALPTRTTKNEEQMQAKLSRYLGRFEEVLEQRLCPAPVDKNTFINLALTQKKCWILNTSEKCESNSKLIVRRRRDWARWTSAVYSELIGPTNDTGALAASWRCHCQRANICILLFNIISFVVEGESLRPRFEKVYKYCTSHLHPWLICA